MKTVIHMYHYVHTSVVQLRCCLYTWKRKKFVKPDIRQTKIKILQKSTKRIVMVQDKYVVGMLVKPGAHDAILVGR
jgi:hypothetical protein